MRSGGYRDDVFNSVCYNLTVSIYQQVDTKGGIMNYKNASIQANIQIKIESLYNYVEIHIPSKGDKESDCQRLCILNRLSDAEHCVNSLTDEDFIERD